MKIFSRNLSLGKKNIHKLKNKQDKIIKEKEEILTTVEEFYRELYEQPRYDPERPNILKIINQCSEDITRNAKTIF